MENKPLRRNCLPLAAAAAYVPRRLVGSIFLAPAMSFLDSEQRSDSNDCPLAELLAIVFTKTIQKPRIKISTDNKYFND